MTTEMINNQTAAMALALCILGLISLAALAWFWIGLPIFYVVLEAVQASRQKQQQREVNGWAREGRAVGDSTLINESTLIDDRQDWIWRGGRFHRLRHTINGIQVYPQIYWTARR